MKKIRILKQATYILAILFCISMFTMTSAKADGFVDLYDAYDTSYQEVYPNGYDELNDFIVLTSTGKEHPLPKAFRFEVTAITDSYLTKIIRLEEPIYIEAAFGENKTKQIKFNFIEDGEEKELNMNLSMNPIYNSSYYINFAFNGQMKEKARSYQLKNSVSGHIPWKDFEGYPYILLYLESSHSLLLKLVEIVPGDKMTDQMHWKYTGETIYEQVNDYGTKELADISNNIKDSYYIIDYDKEADIMRKSAEVTEIWEDLWPERLNVYDVGDMWEFTISSGINNAPDTIFYNDILTIKSKASVLKWSKPELIGTQGSSYLNSPLSIMMSIGSSTFSEDFINPDRVDDYVYKNKLHTGRSYENPEIITQEVDMTAEINPNHMYGEEWSLTVLYRHGDTTLFKIHRIYERYDPPFFSENITIPDAPSDIIPDKDEPAKEIPAASNVSIDTDADDKAGESSVSIPATLAVVIIGGVTAAAGAGIGSGDSGSEDRKKKSSYKMCLNKDFGNAIRYDSPSVTVYTRIVEITEQGDEIDRPDLSANLQIFSGGGLKVESTAMAGNYMGAQVCAESTPGVQNPDTGVLSIRYQGEGGSFQNNVSFRLIGKPYIHFPERGKELTPTVYMLYGDKGDYELPIELLDYAMPVDKVRLELPGDQPFTAKAEKLDDSHYVLRLHNTSQLVTDRPQPQQLIMITVYGENEKESAHDNFIVNMLPEGLSLRPFTGCPIDENGRLLVACSLKPEQGEDETDIEQTHFQLVLAASRTDDNGIKHSFIVDSSKLSYQFESMTSRIDKLQNLLKAFSYEIDSSEATSAGIFRICPKRQLPQDDRLDYDVSLPVSCDYENQTYRLDIPIRLLGDKLLPMAEKSEEISLLIKRIKKYVDEEDIARLIREFKDDLPKMSALDVRLLSKSLVYASQAEVYKANRHLLNAELLDWVCWGLDWYKWIGDQAISVIISKLSGNKYAPFVEAVVMPAKDLLVEHMGTWLADYISGAPSQAAVFDRDQLESTGLTMIENTLTNLIDGSTTPKKAAGILSIYLVIKTANYYFYEKNDDGSPIGIYGAVTSAFGDLTSQSFKIIIGTKLEQLAKNPATTKIFGGYADEFVKKLFPAEFYNNGGEWEFDLIKKYIEEITVLASAKIYSGVNEGAASDEAMGKIVITLLGDIENPEKTVKISLSPLDLGIDFFNYIFDKLFGMFAFADTALEAPKDPPYMQA